MISKGRTVAAGLVVAGAALASVPATAQLQCAAGTLLYHPGGDLKGCRIEADHRFYTARGDAITCKGGHMVVQHANGEVASCTIATPHSFAGVACPGPGRVRLDPDGTMRACE